MKAQPTPCRGKSIIVKIWLLPLQGEFYHLLVPRALPWASSFLALQAVFEALSDQGRRTFLCTSDQGRRPFLCASDQGRVQAVSMLGSHHLRKLRKGKTGGCIAAASRIPRVLYTNFTRGLARGQPLLHCGPIFRSVTKQPAIDKAGMRPTPPFSIADDRSLE